MQGVKDLLCNPRYCYLQRSCGEVFDHPDGNVVQTYRKRRTSPQRRRLGLVAVGPGDATLQFPTLRTVLAIGATATHVRSSAQ